MSEELENALNLGDMERAVNILAQLKGRGVRLSIDCVENREEIREESKRQESIHSISPRKMQSPPVPSAISDSGSHLAYRMDHSYSSASSQRTASNHSVKPFVIEEPPPAKPLSPVKRPASIERPAFFNPEEKKQDYSPAKPLSSVMKQTAIGHSPLFKPDKKEQDYSPAKPFSPVIQQTFIGRPALFKPDEKDDSSSDCLTPPDERSPDRVNTPSVTSKCSAPNPPAWSKPKEQVVQEYHSIHSQASEYQSSFSMSKLH